MKRKLKDDEKKDERIDVVERRVDELIEEDLKDSPAEELNKQLEQEFKLKKHTKALVAKGLCALLLTVAFLSYFKGKEPYESFRGFCIGGAIILYGFICIAGNRFSFFGDLYHKKAYPVKYWLSICSLFILGTFSIIVFGVYGP